MRKLVISIFNTFVLLFFVTKMENFKFVLIPFIVCSLSVAGQSLGELLHNDRMANLFRRIYVDGFALFWFGFVSVGVFQSVRERNYGMVLYLLLFAAVGYWVMRKPKREANGTAKFNTGLIIACGLVCIALLAGVFLLVLGFMRHEGGLIFGGAFFLMGGIAFVLGGLSVKGCFDNCKIDVVGLYFGIVFVIVGIGFFIMAYQNPANVPRLVLVIPALMAVAGAALVVKCIKNRK